MPLARGRNAVGPIAETYDELQALPWIRRARERHPLPRASASASVRAVFQAAEIALLNLADLTSRAAARVAAGDRGTAGVHLAWAHGFHRVLSGLSRLPAQMSGELAAVPCRGILHIAESPAMAEYLGCLERFDATLQRSEDGSGWIERALADGSLDDPDFRLLHFARLSAHQAIVWEESLAAVPVPDEVPSLERFLGASELRRAVYDTVLAGDTFYAQFRGLHQIPETLAFEVIDRLEEAAGELAAGRPAPALAHLRVANLLFEGILSALPAIADNLATSDYHRIRENLGLTSGSHSIGLRYQIFGSSYERLWEALARELGEPLEERVREADRRRFEDPRSWLQHDLIDEALRLGGAIVRWRFEHLHLPRNHLGSGGTRSLVGSSDGLRTAHQMQEAARGLDAEASAMRARGLAGPTVEPAPRPLERHMESSASLDQLLLATTGRIARERFVQVQERTGFFAKPCPFSPPHRKPADDDRDPDPRDET